jgi:hypothetical protein
VDTDRVAVRGLATPTGPIDHIESFAYLSFAV